MLQTGVRRDLDEGVIVVPHQDIGEQLDAVFPERQAQPLDEVAAIVVDDEEIPSVASMRRDVVDAGFELTQRSWHA